MPGSTFRPDVPGSPEITVVPSLVRGPRVSVGGEQIKPVRARGRPTYPIPMADGSERPLSLVGAILGTRAIFDGREYPVERRLSWIELFLVVLPLSLLGFGGALGLVVAGVAVLVNLVVMKQDWSTPIRVLAALAVFAAAIALVATLPAFG